MRALITGSCGLIGSDAVEFYCEQGWEVIGIDNNMRKKFFGSQGDTSWRKRELVSKYKNYTHKDFDIRDREKVRTLFKRFRPSFVIHAASQPSHDWAAREPFTDFEVNAVGTLNLLEGFREFSPQGTFCFLSTNKVYGDSPNRLPMVEMAGRFEYRAPFFKKGVNETQSVDQCKHSLFGASKLAADTLCQEYGRYFGLNVGIFRGGCLTGSKHSGVQLHGFLSYLVDCAVKGQPYHIIGYRGKQVRDQIHSRDVVHALDCFRRKPRPGEVYNLGGGYENSSSILEIIHTLSSDFGIEMKTTYTEEPRIGDHICYYSDMAKFRSHYPEFFIEHSLRLILSEMIESARERHLSNAGRKKAA